MMLSRASMVISDKSYEKMPIDYNGDGNLQVMWDVSDELNIINVGVMFADLHENSGRGWVKESYFIEVFYRNGIVEDKFKQPHKILERIIDQAVVELSRDGIQAGDLLLMPFEYVNGKKS